MPSNQSQSLKMETVILKVNVNCNGCYRRVKKILKKIEGVYAVNIDVEHQRAIVRGIADSSTLIKKLAKSGKHAEVWIPKAQRDVSSDLQGKPKNKNPHHQNNSSRRAISLDQLMYPDQEMELNAEEIANLYLAASGGNNRINGNQSYENDVGAMISMMGIHGHHDVHQQQHGHVGNSIGLGRSGFQNYPPGLAGYGFQQQPSPLMVENLLASQYNQNPYGAWHPQSRVVLDNNYRMHAGYVNMYHHC